MKKTIVAISLILLLVVFPFLGSEAFAEFIGKGPFPMDLFVDPVNLILLAIGLTFVGSRA